ncbi:MAG: deoxyguanosinetriphosphate triphosphohydrolase [Micrococcaceae bacterium]
MYTAFDSERIVPETHQNTHRTDFERDRARVLHSSALRRLGAKTQVVSPDTDDFVRTRLTHSLEVAQVGRELAGALGCDRDIVDAACLSHDLGHPPFGHNGETALNEIAADIGGFEGNAQTLRLLSRLEPKVFSSDGTSVGLNLTRASLDASCKYPWLRDDAPQKHGLQTTKFGVYEDDLPIFSWMRANAPEHQTCLEAQVMDLSDDIAYSVHDVEDAVAAGHADLRTLHDEKTRAEVFKNTQEWYLPHASTEQLETVLTHLQSLPYWAEVGCGQDGLSLHEAAQLKEMTSQLIGRFVYSSLAETLNEYGHSGLVRYNAQLSVPYHTILEIALLKGITATFVMSNENRKPLYEKQRKILKDLVTALREEPEYLERRFKEQYHPSQSDAQALRVVVDQVASMTDISALDLHKKLFGIAS